MPVGVYADAEGSENLMVVTVEESGVSSEYQWACYSDCIKRGEFPVPSEMIGPDGIGRVGQHTSSVRAVYVDRGLPTHMDAIVREASQLGERISFRSLGGRWKK